MTMLSASALGLWRAADPPAGNIPGASWLWGWLLILPVIVLIAGLAAVYWHPRRLRH
jgi:hypothetical protein